MIEVSSSRLRAIEFSTPGVPKELSAKAGVEHYRLLALLSSQMPDGSTVFDIGSHMGASATALAYNKSIRVASFDINLSKVQHHPVNVDYHCENLWDAPVLEKWESRILQSPLIFLDIDPHEGTRELTFYHWLKRKEYRGILVLDDIWYFEAMRNNFWFHVDHPRKYDLTQFGHWSGTGVVDFSGQLDLQNYPDTRNWTLVTAYFDLTKERDASDAIKARPSGHYLRYARATMAVEQNLIVFCDEANREALYKLRPAHLRSATKYIVMDFSDLNIYQYRDVVIENRKKKPYRFDPRNTASYYIFCMSRYEMVRRAIEENPFKSTHFAWVNVCIERMGWKNVANLTRAFGINRNKFSTCWIDYQPKSMAIHNWKKYFEFGRCGMCSGFFTGRSDYFLMFIEEIMKAFRECVSQGYGHADEQLFSIAYFRRPEIFEHYFGDYQTMVTNYVECFDPTTTARHFIPNSLKNRDYGACLRACDAVRSTMEKLPENLKLSVKNYERTARAEIVK